MVRPSPPPRPVPAVEGLGQASGEVSHLDIPFLILVIGHCSHVLHDLMTQLSFQQRMVFIAELYLGEAKRSGYRQKGNSSTKIEIRNLADMASTI